MADVKLPIERQPTRPATVTRRDGRSEPVGDQRQERQVSEVHPGYRHACGHVRGLASGLVCGLVYEHVS